MATYEGWKNWETWAVNLNLSNNEGAYRHWSEIAEDYLADYPRKSDAVNALADTMSDELTDFVDQTAFKKLPEYAQELLIMDIREIDWKEIAEHWIRAAKETLDRR